MAEYDLMQHQREGVDFLDRVDGVGALLYDPGVGKTGVALTWIDNLAQKRPNREVRVLVIAPLTAADTWVFQAPMFMDSVVKARLLQGSTKSILKAVRSARNWTDVPSTKVFSDHPGIRRTQVSGNRVTILSLSAGAISSFCSTPDRRVQMLRAIRAYKPDVVVVDESQIIKTAGANISKSAYQIGQLAPHRLILTGTVTPLSPLDVYGQWRFLAPWTFSDHHGFSYTDNPSRMTQFQVAEIRPWSWTRFKDRYSEPGGYKNKGIGGFKNLDELNSRVAERAHVVLKADALDLPPVQDVDVHVTLSPKEAAAYQQMKDELAMELTNGELLEAPNALAKMMKLRQIASGFVKDTETGEIHIIGDSLRKSVKEVCQVTLETEKRIVVFAYFRAECERLADMLRQRGTTVEVVTGSTKADERLAIRKRFGDVSGNPERIILVAQQRTMSVSVNELVTAQNAVFASMSERREDWVQARGRLDRNGQKGQHVTFWNVMSPGLIGEIMRDRHEDRGDLESALLNHIMSATPVR